MSEFSDFSRPANVTLVAGTSGYGKTTACYRLLVNRAKPQPKNPDPAGTIFIFDWKLEAEKRLGIPAVTTAAGCEAALQNRCVVFNPHSMFPGDQTIVGLDGKEILNDARAGLRWFANWCWSVSGRGPGVKILYVDELREFGNKFSVMPEISRIIRNGRFRWLEFLTSSQYPRDYHPDIRAGVTEWILFNLSLAEDLDAVKPYFREVEILPTLPRGEFIAVNMDGRATRRAKIF